MRTVVISVATSLATILAMKLLRKCRARDKQHAESTATREISIIISNRS